MSGTVENPGARTTTARPEYPDRSEFTTAAVGVVALCFALHIVARGMGETFAVFYGSLLDEFGWSRVQVSSIYSVFMLGIGIGGPCIGLLFDRVGGRAVYAGGLLAYGLGFLLASRMEALWQGYLGLGILLGVGAAATGMTPATALLARWFDRAAWGSPPGSPMAGWRPARCCWRRCRG